MNKFKKSGSWEMGNRAETLFSSALDKKGIPWRYATKKEQIQKHIDFHTDRGTVDVKCMKKINRVDYNPQQDFIWLEFQNVRGNTGWLCSEVDYIAFERPNDFVIVDRQRLLELAKSLCDLTNMTRQGGMKALYRGYQRQGRKDIISMIKMSDVLTLPFKSLPK
jgi:hypothetical protein